jgi:hypothetical protein
LKEIKISCESGVNFEFGDDLSIRDINKVQKLIVRRFKNHRRAHRRMRHNVKAPVEPVLPVEPVETEESAPEEAVLSAEQRAAEIREKLTSKEQNDG